MNAGLEMSIVFHSHKDKLTDELDEPIMRRGDNLLTVQNFSNFPAIS